MGDSGTRRRLARDRRGRGLRGRLVPPRVPLARTPAELFDELVLDAVEDIETHWGPQIQTLEFAVEPVPPLDALDGVADGDPVPLSRLLPSTGSGPTATAPRIVLYRRPIEARALDAADLGDLIHDVVVHEVSRHLGIDPDEVDEVD